MEMTRADVVKASLKAFVVLMLLGGVPARAETGVTNIVNGVISNAGGDYIVGDTGPFNALIVTNAGRLISAAGTIGANAEASNNLGLITGSGSLWTNTFQLNIGRFACGNSLRIANGGQVISTDGAIGTSSNACDNTVLVTGSDSMWDSGTLNIGNGGSGNQLTINNGGSVLSRDTSIGSGNGSNNTVFVSGSGSVWVTTSTFNVGKDGSGNHLTISNGGWVGNPYYWWYKFVGYLGASSNANNNRVTVSGNGSRLRKTEIFYVGYSGSFNQVTISDGGQVLYGVDGYVGYSACASNNAVLVSGSGSVWNNTNILSVGNEGCGNQLTISNGGRVGGGDNFVGYVGACSNANNNAVSVSGSGSVLECSDYFWSFGSRFYVGYSGSFNQVTISNGGQLACGNGSVGYSTSARSNAVLVTGSGSVWSNKNQLGFSLGYNGTGNQLIIANSGQFLSANGYIGYGDGSNNSVVVSGSGSAWRNSGTLCVGYNGRANELTITSGGQLVSTDSYFVYIYNQTNAEIFVGMHGSGNQLTISNGGRVVNVNGYLGRYSDATNNSATVSGSGSSWSILDDLYVGRLGVGNRLTVTNSGSVSVGDGVYVGFDSGADNNQITLAGGTLNAGTLDLLRGALIINRGTIVANRFYADDGTSSVVIFNGGLLRSGGTGVSNGVPFVVGDGARAATLDLLNGTHAFSDGVVVASNATLTGVGTLLGPVTVSRGGTMSAGHNPGLLALGSNLALASGARLLVELAGYTAGSGYDQLIVTGLLSNNNATLAVALLDGFTPSIGAQFVIVDNTNAGYGTFLGAAEGSTNSFGSGVPFTISYSGGGDHHDIVLTAVVPEPCGIVLAALGAAVLLLRRQKEEQQSDGGDHA